MLSSQISRNITEPRDETRKSVLQSRSTGEDMLQAAHEADKTSVDTRLAVATDHNAGHKTDRQTHHTYDVTGQTDQSNETDETDKANKTDETDKANKIVETDFAYEISDDVRSWLGNTSAVPPLTLHTDFLLQPIGLCPTSARMDYLIVVHR